MSSQTSSAAATPLQLSSLSLQATSTVYQPANPFAQLSNEFGLKEADEVHAWLFMKANSLRHQHERNAIHNHARESARTLLLKLQNLRDLGATAQQLRQAGVDTLKELEASSSTMMAAFERFQYGRMSLENRYSQFDASASKPANELTFTSIFEPSPSQANPVSPLLNVLEKYRYNHHPEPASVLATVNNKVNRIANVQPAQAQDVKKNVDAPAKAATRENDFATPQVALSDRMKNRKNAMAKCLLTSMDPESITGAMPCVAKHAEGLSESEKKELDAAVPNLVAGKALTELAAVPATISKAVHTVVKGAAKGLMLSSMSEAILRADPAHYDEHMREARRALNGENPEINKMAREMMTTTATVAAKGMKVLMLSSMSEAVATAEPHNYDERMREARKALNGENPEFNKLMREVVIDPVKHVTQIPAAVDRYTQERFNTLPGIVKDGIIGTAELGTVYVGPAIKGSVNLVRATLRETGRVYRALETALTASQVRKVAAKAVEALSANRSYLALWEVSLRQTRTSAEWSTTAVKVDVRNAKNVIESERVFHPAILEPTTGRIVQSRILANLVTEKNCPKIQKFMGQVYESIKSSPGSTKFNNLLGASRDVDLKLFSNTTLEQTPFIQNLIKTSNSNQIEFHPIPNQNNRNLITRVSTQKGDFILKEFKDGHDLIGEVMGYELLRPLNLQNLIIPEVVAIGQERELFFTLKSYLEGSTLGELILSSGAKITGSLEREAGFQECLAATKQTGKALGELQRKTSQNGQVLPKDFVDKDCKFWVKLLKDYIEMANADLKKLGLPQIEISGIDFMVKQRSLMATPPYYSYGFGDIHPGQFVYSKRRGTIGYIDAEYFPSSVGLSQEPLSVGIKDYYLFYSNLEITGILSGLKTYEIKYLQQSFKEGFYSEFPLRRPQPAQEFFELYSAVDTIAALTEDEVVKRFIATKGNAGASFLKQQLQNKVKSINEKIGGQKRKLIANSLTPEHLGLKNLPSGSKIGRIGMTPKKMLTIAIEQKDFQNFQPGTFNLFSIIGNIQKLALEGGATSIRVSFPYHEKVLSILEKRYDTTVKTIDLIHEQMPHKIVVKLPVPGASREAFPMEGQTIRLDKYKQLTPLELDLIPDNLRKFEVFSRLQDGIYHVKIDHVIPKKVFHLNFFQLKKRISALASENQAHTVRLHFGFDWEPETNQRMHQLLIRMFGEPKMNTATVSFDFKLTTNAYK